MLGHFHANPAYRVDLGSVVAIGEPWIPHSTCDHSAHLPFLYLWIEARVAIASRYVHADSVGPSNHREGSFLREDQRVGGLKRIFDAVGLDYLNPHRASVV